MKFSERKKILSEAVKRDARVVLYLVEDTKSAQFRYRCKNVAEAVDGGEWRVVWFLKTEIEGVDLDGVSLVVIERQTDKDGAVGRFIDRVHRAGMKVVFDLDDLIFDYKDLALVMQTTNSKNIFYWAGYFWGIRRIARKVDGFICTNEFLAGKLKRSFGKSVQVIPNSLNASQVEVSEKCVADGGKKHKGFVVGYFSGSPTHAKDFAMVESELICFLKEHDDVKLLVVGYMKFSFEMQKMIEAGKVVVHELVDYLELQKLMAGVDVNIAPLIVNDFTNCKSELKFFEAALVETTTMASMTYAFEKAMVDGENGMLVSDDEWCEKLEYLYEYPKENREMALVAKKYALKHYYGKEFLKKVEEVYEYFTK